MNFVQYYLREILMKQLCDMGNDNSYVEKIIQNIECQMLSLLKHWNDEKFRKTVLFIGMEESSFYEPFADDDIRSFVVVTVRNSMLEILASDNYAKLGSVRALTDDEVKLITSTGIKYFRDIDFNIELQSLDFTDIQDIYDNARMNYPVVWTAIETLANISKDSEKYNKVAIKKEKALLEKIKNAAGTYVASNDIDVILDGYDCTIDDRMLYLLYKIYTTRNFVMYVDCFKMVSRNFEKLFRIMNFILCCNKPFVTSNYYIANGYVSKRVPLIRPAHRVKDVQNNAINISGLTGKHRKFMLDAIKQF